MGGKMGILGDQLVQVDSRQGELVIAEGYTMALGQLQTADVSCFTLGMVKVSNIICHRISVRFVCAVQMLSTSESTTCNLNTSASLPDGSSTSTARLLSMSKSPHARLDRLCPSVKLKAHKFICPPIQGRLGDVFTASSGPRSTRVWFVLIHVKLSFCLRYVA